MMNVGRLSVRSKADTKDIAIIIAGDHIALNPGSLSSRLADTGCSCRLLSLC